MTTRRITTTITVATTWLWVTAASALAVPGEGFDLEPYGTVPTVTTGAGATEAATSGFDPTAAAMIVIAVVAGLVMASLGYLLGAQRQRRLVAH